VTPYARALSKFLLGHPDCQNFGRKFKPAFSGCADNPCGLTNIHDLGFIASRRVVDGKEQRGFDVYAGGGLGAVPYSAKPFDPFVPVEEILPLAQAMARVFARLGEKKNRARARIKFLIQDLGIEKFKELVLEERKTLPHDPRWVEYIRDAEKQQELPLRRIGQWPAASADPAFTRWAKFNTREQKQAGYSVVTIALPLGDITANQLRALADIARRFTRETIRTTVEQNIVLRWVAENDLYELYKQLDAVRLADPGAESIADIVSCPGTDTCKLGISSSRGLAAELRNRLIAKGEQLDPSVQDLHIKISGCFNSCGQHHTADLGFYGVSRKIGGYAVPHFQVVLGGEWTHNVGSYGMPVMAIPSKNIPEVVNRLTERYAAGRKENEMFKDFIKRMGKAELKRLLDDLSQPPSDPSDRTLFTDWGDPREYSLGDMGIGECAGEVVSCIDFDLAGAERELFEAQIALEAGHIQQAGEFAYQAMLRAARGLVRLEFADISDDPDQIVDEFRTRYFDTQKFFDPFAGGKFAQYLFAAHQVAREPYTGDSARYRIDEAHLFIEAAHSCYQRISTPPAPPVTTQSKGTTA
jgi:sulfite reductase (ferredoxin)